MPSPAAVCIGVNMAISGVYQILNLANGKRYIGSSVDLKGRWMAHKSGLNAGKHGNRHLQRAWDKYGKDNFEFEIICSCPEDKTIEFEQFFLDARHPEYNIAKCARASALGMHHTEEAKRKISEACKNPSVETRHKMSKAQRGRHFSEETKHKISEAKKGKHLSAEIRRKLSESHKEQTAWNKGKHLSKEHKRKLSKSHKGKKSGRWIHFTEDEINKMRAFKDAGDSYNAIGRKFNVSPQTIKRRLIFEMKE